MAPSSCHDTKIKHDVFISFRGTDVRCGLLSHLIKELRRGQIDAYVDDRLERGDEISSSLDRAIEGSQILLVIFSKDYASSKWCLDELVKMMEGHERNKQIVVPVFYKVDPSHVRHQKGDYGAALAEHEEKEDMVKVQNWRSALKKAAQLSGFHYPSNFENESELVDEITKDISNKLSKLCSSGSDDPSESNGLVGIFQNIAGMKSLLTTKSTEVIKLGIWGMGGIGKTTIARAIFDTFSRQYQGCCFLENVGDEMKNHPLSCLHKKLVFALLEEENLHINGRGKANFTKRRLSRMKVLIVLDDVDTPNLLKDFLDPIHFGQGSSVIVTSRDKKVFTAGGFHEIHQVKELNFEESLELFCINAFNESQPKRGYEELSKKAVAIAKGNPLALKVFGSHFHSKNKDTWECALKKLKKYPNGNIQRVLRLSYDGLDDLEKKVFLDIAFFLKEEHKDYVIRLLDAWGFHGACGIEALQEKALITISNDNRIQMHDLIQEMGWEIVRQESTDLGRRSRLRDAEEVYDVLKNNKGTDLVEGMLLDVSQIGELASHVDSFKRMPNLRLLKVYSPLIVWELMYTTYFVPEGSSQVDGMQTLYTITKKHRLALPVHVEDIMVDWPIKHDFMNVMLQKMSELRGIPKLANNNECNELLMTNNSPGSALKELMSLGSETHIKSLHYHFMDGCSVPKDFSTLAKEIGAPNSIYTATETTDVPIWLHNILESSDIGGLPYETLPKELTILRSAHFLRLPNCRGQVTRIGQLQALFNASRYFEQMRNNSRKLLELIDLEALDIEQCDVQRLISKNFSVFKKEIRPPNSTHSGMQTLNSSIGLPSWLRYLQCSCSDTEGLKCENVGPKESSVLPKEMRQLNLTNNGMELLDSSKGHFSSLECSEIDGLQLETLSKKVTILRSAYYHRLPNCREQDTRKPKLQVLFDGFRYSKRISFLSHPESSLQMSTSRRMTTLRSIDITSGFLLVRVLSTLQLTNWLGALVLDGCSMERFPLDIKHLSLLKKLSLRGCMFLQSVPELPPSIQILDAYNCALLETVAFSSNAAGSFELKLLDISFQNCTSLNMKKFRSSFHQHARALAHGYKLRRQNGCVIHFSVCYPASKVPEWFTNRTQGASITVELASPSKDLFSCLLCLVLSPSNYPITVQVECQSYCEDGDMPRYATRKCFLREFREDLDSDHVCMWYLKSHFLREIMEGIVNDQYTSSSYDPKVTFRFSFVVKAHSDMPKQKLDRLIKECGVCPLYFGDDLIFIKTKRHRDVFDLETTGIRNGVGSCGDQEPFPPTKNLKGLI